MNLSLIVVHINYGLRGKDSKRDEELARQLANKYSLKIKVLKKTQKSKNLQAQPNLEERLRKIRYDFFEKVRKKNNFDFIAVGHNFNDQAETVMMRILRGTGLRGLGAIKFKNEKIIRPLLNVKRSEIIAHLRQNKIPYRIDKTNLGTDFTRNQIRNRLFPYLEKNFNPKIQELLCSLSQSASNDYDFIQQFSREWLNCQKELKISELRQLHPSILREVLRLKIEKTLSHLREIESAHLNEIIKIIESNKSKDQKFIFKGLKVERKGDRLVIGKM